MLTIFRLTLKSLFSKLLYSYLVLIVIPVILISIFTYKSSQEIINDYISQYERNSVEQMGQNFQIMLDQMISAVNIYNTNNSLKLSLKDEYEDDYHQLRQIRDIEEEMLKYTTSFDWLRLDAIILGTNGVVYSSSYQKPEIDLDQISSLDWYDDLLRYPDRIKWLNTHPSFFRGQNKALTFSGAKILHNEITRDFYGILLLSMSEDNLYNIYSKSLSGNNIIFIADASGQIISHSDRSLTGTAVDMSFMSELLADDEESRIGPRVVEYEGEKYLSVYKAIDKVDLYVVELKPLTVFYKATFQLRDRIIFIAILCMFAVVMGSIFISRKISAPLIVLSRKIHRYRFKENMNYQYQPRVDEIALLNTEYEKLVSELDTTIQSLMKEQEEKRKTELQSLQMQINPHFMYNTLNSLKSLVWTNQVDQIIPTIDAFVKLLVETINRDDEFITLEEEIRLVQDYIFIQEIRTASPIKLNVHIDEQLKQVKLPKLLLQPIVENSIFHGLESKQSEGVISISCTESDEIITIEIVDNGSGMSPETLKNILSDGKEKGKRFSSIGIKNVDSRLKLYFGSAFGLEIKSAVGIGTSVMITMPKI